MPSAVEADAHFHYRKPAKSEAFGVLLQVDLPHRLTGILIEFHLYYIKVSCVRITTSTLPCGVRTSTSAKLPSKVNIR